MKDKKRITYLIVIITSSLLFLNLTRLNDIAFFNYLFLANFIVSSITIVGFNYKSIISKDFIKKNLIILLIILFSAIGICIYGFCFNDIKAFAYLSFFLIVINCLIDKSINEAKSFSKTIFKICIIINLASFILALLEYLDLKIFAFPIVEAGGNFNFYGLYTNPNAFGVGSFISLILYYTLLRDDNKKIVNILYIVFLLICIVVSSSRASLISIIMFFMMMFCTKKYRVNKEIVSKIFITIIAAFFAFITVLSVINSDNTKLTNMETTLNKVTTNRYILWKYSVLSINEPHKLLFGIQSSNIGDARVKEIPSKVFSNFDPSTTKVFKANNNHNGYVQLLVSSGMICLVLVLAWVYFGIIDTDVKYLPIVLSILFLNFFENEFVNTHSLSLFILCYFLYFKDRITFTKIVNNLLDKCKVLRKKIDNVEIGKTVKKLKSTGFFSIFISSVFGKVVVFLANILLARLLSKSDYGLYAYIFNCFAILTLLGDFGTSSAAMQYISENINSEKDQFKYLKYSIVVGSLLSIISGLLIVTSPLFYPYTLDESAGIVQLFFLIPFITTIANIFAIILRAHQKNKEFARYNFLTVFVNYLLLIPLTCLLGIKGVVYATYGYHIFSALYAIYLSRHYLKKFFNRYAIKAKEKIDFIKFSFIMQVNITLSHLLLIIDTFVIGLIISDSNTIATYKVANSIPQALAFIPTCVVIYILPYFIKHNKERKWLSTNIKKIIVYGGVVYGIFAGGLILFSNLIISLLYGAQYKDAVLPFCILILGFYFNATFTVPCSSIMQGLRKVNVNLVISIISLVLNLILNFVFIKIFGFVGVAITTTLIQIITSAYYLYYLKKKIMVE